MGRPHNITIARSGVQYYLKSELPSLGLTSIPREFKDLQVFGVYRSAIHIERAAPMFKQAPVVVGHQHWVEGPTDPHVIGTVGDEIAVKIVNGEAIIHSTLEFTKDEFDDKKSALSPGYRAKYSWANGISPDGVEYQIVSKDITSVNHLALVPKARGGAQIRILDGGGQVKNKILSGLVHYAKKMLGVADTDLGAFRTTMEDIVKNRREWTDEEMAEHCNTLMAFTTDLPDSEEKQKLQRFIADLPLIKNEDDQVANQAGIVLSDLYEQLDVDAVEDVTGQTTQGAEMLTPETKGAEISAPAGVPPAIPQEPVNVAPQGAAGGISAEQAMFALKGVYTLLKLSLIHI